MNFIVTQYTNFETKISLSSLNAGGSGFRLNDSPNIKLTIWFIGVGQVSVSWPIGSNWWLLLPQCFSGVADTLMS